MMRLIKTIHKGMICDDDDDDDGDDDEVIEIRTICNLCRV
jgi:hypothetical protein